MISPTSTSELAAIGELLRAGRERTGLTQSETARRAGVSRHTVIRMESGEIAGFVPLVKVARTVGVHLDQIASEYGGGVTSPNGAAPAQQEG